MSGHGLPSYAAVGTIADGGWRFGAQARPVIADDRTIKPLAGREPQE
jgi:hypothetical protein